MAEMTGTKPFVEMTCFAARESAPKSAVGLRIPRPSKKGAERFIV